MLPPPGLSPLPALSVAYVVHFMVSNRLLEPGLSILVQQFLPLVFSPVTTIQLCLSTPPLGVRLFFCYMWTT